MLAALRRKNLHTWLGGWVRSFAARRPQVRGPRHLLFAFCDHYEPLHGDASREVGRDRVSYWRDRYPLLADRYRDADGRPPRHSFFFPGEQYDPRNLDVLGDLARGGYGEVEVHLHHDGDTEETLRRDMQRYLGEFASHGHLSRGPDGKPRYAFIHGNWCLSNARADGRWCGVDAELPLLFDTGCYADFTFPSAPDECQPNVVNQIYWPTGDLSRRRAYEHAERAAVGVRYDDRMLFVPGPIALARRPGSAMVRIESSAITAKDPGSKARVESWVSQGIHVQGRPEWIFVKVHTHGAPETQAESLLGDGGRALHEALRAFDDRERWFLHYVTAREMYNVAMAAIDGKTGNPNDHRDHVLPPPPVAR
ncbi:MAG: hypothetical protein ACXVEF_23365 [Polyangiales bacterium]